MLGSKQSLIVFVLFLNCQNDMPMNSPSQQPIQITLNVTGPVGEARTVRTIVSINGQEKQRFTPMALDAMGKGSFSLILDPGTRGTLKASVQAIADDALLTDSAQASVVLDADKPYAVDLPLIEVDYCGGDTWCWARPKRVGTGFTDIWGTSADDIWVVGESGRPLHYDGFAFSEVPLIDDKAGTSEAIVTPSFSGIHGTSKTDVWASSTITAGRRMRQALWKYDGAAFRSVYRDVENSFDPTFGSILVTSNYVWVGGLRFDLTGKPISTSLPAKTAILRMLSPNQSNPDDIWAAGRQMGVPTILHWTGSSWQTESVPSPTTVSIYHLYYTADGQMLASETQNGQILKYQGGNWTYLSSSPMRGVVYAGTSLNDLWLVKGPLAVPDGSAMILQHWDGNSLQSIKTLPLNLQIKRAFAAPASEQKLLFLIGDGGVIYRFDRNSGELTTLLKGASPNSSNLYDVYGFSASDIWAIGDNGTIVNYDGKSWKNMNTVTGNKLKRIWGVSSKDIWAVGEKGSVVHIVNSQPKIINGVTSENLNSVWGVSANMVYAVGDNSTILSWNGVSWSPVPIGVSAKGNWQAVWASGDTNVWIGGNDAKTFSLIRYNGINWSPVTLPYTWVLPDVYSIRGSSSRNVLIGANLGNGAADLVGAGTLFHYNGASWDYTPRQYPYAVVSFGSDTNYSIGDSIFYYPADQPGRMPGPRNCYGLWGPSAADLWTVGDQGTILHLNPKR